MSTFDQNFFGLLNISEGMNNIFSKCLQYFLEAPLKCLEKLNIKSPTTSSTVQ